MTLASTTARAEETDSDYCRKVTARAEADSDLLFAPTLHAQVIRFPASGYADTKGLHVGSRLQPRAAMSIGFVDIYKGIGVRDLAKKDCLRQETTTKLQEMLSQRNVVGLDVAISKKLAYLRSKESEQQALVKHAEERLAAGSGTIIELNELRSRVLHIALRSADAERTLVAMRARGAVAPTESIEQIVAEHEKRSGSYEEAAEHLRKITPWSFNLTGGVTARPDVDYFGFVELSYNTGGLFQRSAESRATAARASELKNARYEVRQQVEALRRELRAEAEVLRRQVTTIDEQLRRLADERATLEPTDAPNKSHLLAMLTLQVVDLEAERLFLNTLAERQSAIGGRQ
ncbi:MAG: hypothetical protein KF764_01595 [Labilithrix sp.]|nr:hypothetical protein [Labilithrix sp.]